MNPGEPELSVRSCKHAVALLLSLRMCARDLLPALVSQRGQRGQAVAFLNASSLSSLALTTKYHSRLLHVGTAVVQFCGKLDL